jgi:hypothetical protein
MDIQHGIKAKKKQKISRMWIIRQLCKKHYRTVRPTAHQINNIIHMYKLNRYSVDGKKRSKEVIKEYIAKAYAKLN